MMIMKDPCENCPSNLRPYYIGSETCGAIIGDYCRAMGGYLFPYPEEWQFYDEETKQFYLELFSQKGVDIPEYMCYNTNSGKEVGNNV
jgi:hypothetical protein